MHSAKLNEEQENLLKELFVAGVLLKYFLMMRDQDDTDCALAHKLAAFMFIESCDDGDFDGWTLSGMKIDLYDEDYKQHPRFTNHPEEPIKLVLSDMEGEPISLEKFLGWRYCIKNRRALISGSGEKNWACDYWAGDEEIPENVVNRQEEMERKGEGYSHGYFDTPFRIKGTPIEQERLFHKVEKLFFTQFDPSAIIWNWNTDISSYFGSGREWGHAHFYTYSLPGSDTVLVIVGSYSD